MQEINPKIFIASPSALIADGLVIICNKQGKASQAIEPSYQTIKASLQREQNPLLILQVESETEADAIALLQDPELTHTPFIFITADTENIPIRLDAIKQQLSITRELAVIPMPFEINHFFKRIDKEVQQFFDKPEGNKPKRERQ